ncbi:MAG TPA: hypothetical protein VGD14_07325 [bacterium]
MYNTITFYTFIGLVVFFIVVEVYRSKFFVRGMIVEFCSSDLGIEEFILSRLKVRLKNGQVVEAEASRCTMCMGNLALGDEVPLLKKDERYVVNLTFRIKNGHKNPSLCFNKT